MSHARHSQRPSRRIRAAFSLSGYTKSALGVLLYNTDCRVWFARSSHQGKGSCGAIGCYRELILLRAGNVFSTRALAFSCGQQVRPSTLDKSGSDARREDRPTATSAPTVTSPRLTSDACAEKVTSARRRLPNGLTLLLLSAGQKAKRHSYAPRCAPPSLQPAVASLQCV